jgi:hypothetical protein
MSENTSLNSLYSHLYSAFKEAFPKSKGFNGKNYCFSDRSLLFNEFWRENKKNVDKIREKIIQLHSRANKYKTFSIIDSFNKLRNSETQPTGQVMVSNDDNNIEILEQTIHTIVSNDSPNISNELSQDSVDSTIETQEIIDRPDTARQTPAQEKVKQELNGINEEILKLKKAKDLGLAPNDYSIRIKNLMNSKQKKESHLNKLIKSSFRMKRYRSQKSSSLMDLNREHPEIMKKYKIIEGKKGRPRIETDQEGLLETIIHIAINGGAADGRRQSEIINTCKTLDDLNEYLKEKGLLDRSFN